MFISLYLLSLPEKVGTRLINKYKFLISTAKTNKNNKIKKKNRKTIDKSVWICYNVYVKNQMPQASL